MKMYIYFVHILLNSSCNGKMPSMNKRNEINICTNRWRRRTVNGCSQRNTYRIRYKLFLTIWIYLFIVFLIYIFLSFSLGKASGRKFCATMATTDGRPSSAGSRQRSTGDWAWSGGGMGGGEKIKPEKQIKTRPEAVCVNAVWTGVTGGKPSSPGK